MWRSIVLIVVLAAVLSWCSDADEGCSCSSNCNPKITVRTSKGSKHSSPSQGRGHKEQIHVASLPIWEYPCGSGLGAPSYAFFPVTHTIEETGSWYTAYRYCKRLGAYSNLLWTIGLNEFECVRKWVAWKVNPSNGTLPIGISMAVWTGGEKTFAVPNPIYRWNYTGIVIHDDFWQAGAPTDLQCVGMNPYSDISCHLKDYNCSTSIPYFPTFTGWVCKRQVLPPP